MKYKRFEDVPVWKGSVKLATRIFKMTANGCFRNLGDVAKQIQRAALSVSNNIAEGFERGTIQELITFLYYARGSAGRRGRFFLSWKAWLALRALNLRLNAETISRQIRGWTAVLQNSPIRGQRHLNFQTQASLEQDKSRHAFKEMLKKYYRQPVYNLKSALGRAMPEIPIWLNALPLP